LFLGLTAVFEIPNLRPANFVFEGWMSLLFLGVHGTALAFVWYNQAIQRLGAQKTVVFNNLVPIFGVIFGWLLLDEPISFSLVVGGLIALVGVFVVNSVTTSSLKV
jgi:drug/metabolite transporter (DMT)-like permease